MKIYMLWLSLEQCTDQEGGGGDRQSPAPVKNHKSIGFLSNTGTDPLKNLKTTKPAFNMLEHDNQHTSETSFKWQNGVWVEGQ